MSYQKDSEEMTKSTPTLWRKYMGKDNKDTELLNPEMVESVLTDICQNSDTPRVDRTILSWLLGNDLKSAALSAGYAPQYATSGVQKQLKKALRGDPGTKLWRRRLDEITHSLPGRYRDLCALRLPAVSRIEGQALRLMEENPAMALERPQSMQLLRQIKNTCGVLSDGSPAPNVIVGSIQVLAKSLHMGEMEQEGLVYSTLPERTSGADSEPINEQDEVTD
jgi:hypothetical protein